MTQSEALIPEGEYTARVESYQTLNEGGGYALIVAWRPRTNPSGAGQPPLLRQHIPLTPTADGGIDLAKGHNVFLDLLREAVGESFTPYDAWTPAFLIGRSARILVRVRKLPNGRQVNEVQGAVPIGSTQLH